MSDNVVTTLPNLSRRGFLKAAGITGSSFLLASVAPSLLAEDAPSLVGAAELNAFVSVSSDGTITIYSGTPDMGQGIKTSLPMIIAEEMGANWDDVVVVQTEDIDPEKYGLQRTGGSYTIVRNYNLMRKVGASAREMFLSAGAIEMEVPRDELTAENSVVRHVSGESRTFAQLAALAYKQQVPDEEDLVYRGRQEYRIRGTFKRQVDSMEIVTGALNYGIDTRLPGMLYGAYEKSPSVGGRIVSANLDELKKMPGVVDAWLIRGNGNVRELMDGIGIVGTSTWAVYKAQRAINAEWDESEASTDNWDEFVAFAEAHRDKPGKDVVVERGDVDKAFSDRRNKVVEGSYEFPYVSHLCLEPMNATAWFKPGESGGKDMLEVWLPTQNGGRFQGVAEKLYGLSKDQVKINVTRMGGSFGRRTSNEYVCEAIELSKRAGAPVKLTWSREDSMRGDFFRVGGFDNLKGALNRKGRLVAWEENYMGVEQGGRPTIGSGLRAGHFPLSTQETVRGRQTMTNMKTLCGPWRAPWSNTHAFTSQCFIHELATAAKRDHVEFLVEMMGEPRWLEEGNIRQINTGRAVDVIRQAAEMSGWGRRLPKGHGLGLAFYFCHAAHVAEVAEVSVDENRKLTLHKVWAAVDVGPIINLSGALTQVQGSIIDGYSTMTGQKITMTNGRINETNLHQYPVLRIPASPEIDVHFIESEYEPTGLGEPALPPLAPAVANAIFDATGERVRKMPLIEAGFTV